MYVGVRTIAKLLAYKESILTEDGFAQTNTMNYVGSIYHKCLINCIVSISRYCEN